MEQELINTMSLDGSTLDLGSQPVSETIQNILLSPNCDIDTILINASTICRNVCSTVYSTELKKDMVAKNTLEAVADNVMRTLQILVSNIEADFACMPTTPVVRYIRVYIADYSTIIPSTYYRFPTDQFVARVEQIVRDRIKYSQNGHGSWKLNFAQLYFESKIPPYIHLQEDILSAENLHNVLMVSHHPIDYHLHSNMNKWILVSSFTGAKHTAEALSEMVFNKPLLPFNQSTHILFGDKVDMKAALQRGAKRKLIETMTKEFWYLLAEKDIETKLHQNQILLPYHI